MSTRSILVALTGFVIIVAGYAVWLNLGAPPLSEQVANDPTPRSVTLSGTYLCLPHVQGAAQTDECTFGMQTDDGAFYAVNFGQSADAMGQFQRNERITAEGFVVPKEALSSSHWQQYDFVGVFTITRMLAQGEASSTAPAGKLDIAAVCRGALAYMTFPDGAAADAFVDECTAGKHPEVIERYKQDMNLGDGAAL